MKKPRLDDAPLWDEASGDVRYAFRLYVAGNTPLSIRALVNLRAFCGAHLRERYQLEVIDVYQEPGRARAEQVIAVPTLVKAQPEPLRRFVGDLSNTELLLRGLHLQHAGEG